MTKHSLKNKLLLCWQTHNQNYLWIATTYHEVTFMQQIHCSHSVHEPSLKKNTGKFESKNIPSWNSGLCFTDKLTKAKNRLMNNLSTGQMRYTNWIVCKQRDNLILLLTSCPILQRYFCTNNGIIISRL